LFRLADFTLEESTETPPTHDTLCHADDPAAMDYDYDSMAGPIGDGYTGDDGSYLGSHSQDMDQTYSHVEGSTSVEGSPIEAIIPPSDLAQRADEVTSTDNSEGLYLWDELPFIELEDEDIADLVSTDIPISEEPPYNMDHINENDVIMEDLDAVSEPLPTIDDYDIVPPQIDPPTPAPPADPEVSPQAS
jgi:hypothetical protein